MNEAGIEATISGLSALSGASSSCQTPEGQALSVVFGTEISNEGTFRRVVSSAQAGIGFEPTTGGHGARFTRLGSLGKAKTAPLAIFDSQEPGVIGWPD